MNELDFLENLPLIVGIVALVLFVVTAAKWSIWGASANWSRDSDGRAVDRETARANRIHGSLWYISGLVIFAVAAFMALR